MSRKAQEKTIIAQINTNTDEPIKFTNKSIGLKTRHFNKSNDTLIKSLTDSSYQLSDSYTMSSDDDMKVSEISGDFSKYFRLEICRYNQTIYINASILLRKFKFDQKSAKKSSNYFNRLTTDDNDKNGADGIQTDTMMARNSKVSKMKIKVRNFQEKKLTYELALSALKFEAVYEKILEDVGFFLMYPDFRDEDQLVLVILCDYVKRKFQKRTIPTSEMPDKGGVSEQPAHDIENSIYKLRTKLNAAIMRTRVKHSIRSLNQLLPELYRESEEFSDIMLVYMWYNSNLASNTDIIEQLTKMGFQRVSAAKNLEHMEFYQDRHCSDVYVFHHDDRELLQESDMVIKKKIAVVQDKSTSLAIHCFIANIVQGEEIVIVNPTNIATVIHIEGLLKNKFGSVVPLAPIRIIRLAKVDDDPKLLQKMGSTSIKIHQEDILTMDPTNEKYRNIRHVFYQAKCTRSAVISPIDFLGTENDDISILKDHAQRAQLNGAKPVKISDCIVRNTTGLKQCFKFPGLRAITYLTHSIYDEENEGLINKTVEQINKNLKKETIQLNGRYELFENIPPNLPMLIEDLSENGILQDKNIYYKPSAETNGFFISVYCKEVKFLSPDQTTQETLQEKSKKKKKKEQPKSNV